MAAAGLKSDAASTPTPCGVWCRSWSGCKHVRLGAGDEGLPGGGSDGYAEGFRRALRAGARPLAVGSAQRAHVPVLERAAESAEADFLGWQRTMGMRQAAGERAFPLAGGRDWTNQGGAQSRGNGAAAGRHRLSGKQASGRSEEHTSELQSL